MLDKSVPLVGVRNIHRALSKTGFRCCLLAVLFVGASLCFAQSSYFPATVLGENAKVDSLKIEWYSKFLTAMHEPSLWEASQTQKT